MGMMVKVGYKQVTNASNTLLKAGPAGLGGFTVVASTGASITVYDNTTNSGTILYTKSGLAVGEVVTFGNFLLAAGTGLYVVVGGTGTINVFYT